ncbi:unnamed protein product [Pedinophyceae sp. YPF-701]|nr:unnamed protein product [Pedinophyceae sp. YPF-701]
MRVQPGDLVAVHYDVLDDDGSVIESSREKDQPVEFESGVGNVVGNPIFQGFDDAVQGLGIGERTSLEAEGPEWTKDLMFVVPREHPEIQRLEGRYKSTGGPQEGKIVELSNGGIALIAKIDEKQVVLDANHMLAGKKIKFELEVLDILRGNVPGGGMVV